MHCSGVACLGNKHRGPSLFYPIRKRGPARLNIPERPPVCLITLGVEGFETFRSHKIRLAICCVSNQPYFICASLSMPLLPISRLVKGSFLRTLCRYTKYKVLLERPPRPWLGHRRVAMAAPGRGSLTQIGHSFTSHRVTMRSLENLGLWAAGAFVLRCPRGGMRLERLRKMETRPRTHYWTTDIRCIMEWSPSELRVNLIIAGRLPIGPHWPLDGQLLST